jgi:hypothetical protein
MKTIDLFRALPGLCPIDSRTGNTQQSVASHLLVWGINVDNAMFVWENAVRFYCTSAVEYFWASRGGVC